MEATLIIFTWILLSVVFYIVGFINGKSKGYQDAKYNEESS